MSDKIEEIRKRHEAGPIGMLPMQALAVAEDDRAFLLAEVERQRAEIEKLRAEVKRLTRERDAARTEVENLYDQVHRWVDDWVDDRAKAQSQADRLREQSYELQRERDEARYFLKIFVHAHASNNAVPPHLEEQARKALEGKP